MKGIKFLLVLILSSFAFAQNAEEAATLLENEQGFGVKAAAIGNAFTGVADDYSAIYWNPAGLAQIRYQQFYGSLNHLKLSTEANYLDNKTTYDQGFTKFQSLGYVYPFPVRRGSLVLAIGYQRVKDLNSVKQFTGYNTTSNDLAFAIYNSLGYDGLILAFDRDFQLTQTIREEGHLSRFSIGSAIDLSPTFSAGATVSFIGGGSDYRLKYKQEDTQNKNVYDIYDQNDQLIERFKYNYYQIEQTVNTDYSGIEFKVGGLWRPAEGLRLGANITFPMALDLEERWRFADELSYQVESLVDNYTYHFVEPYDSLGQFDYQIQSPFKFDLGASYTYKNLMLTAALRYVDWTQLKLEGSDNTPDYYDSFFNRQNDQVPLLLRAITSYALGGELGLLNNNLKLRAGYRYVPSPFKDLEKSADKKYLTVGLGLQAAENATIDIALVRLYYTLVKSYPYDWDYNQTIPPMVTKEKYNIDRLQISFSYNF